MASALDYIASVNASASQLSHVQPMTVQDVYALVTLMGLYLSVTTRPCAARRDVPLSRRQTRHNKRSSEVEGNALRSLFCYLSNLEPATLGISTSVKALSCFPPIIGNLNITTKSHLASL
jgi:hypothetical protein